MSAISSQPGQRSYWCFISYRHADNKEPGRQWATWLHQGIETYEVPEDLVGTVNDRGDTIPERVFPVFRDEEDLPADSDLASPIYRALDASKFLVVICSPRSVESPFVANEISYFKKIGRGERVLAVMIDGEPNVSWDASKQAMGFKPEEECFPEALRHKVGEDGALLEEQMEPIAADFRLRGKQGWTNPEACRRALLKEGKGGAALEAEVEDYRKQTELMKLKVIAGILGVSLVTLTQRDKAHQLALAQRRARALRLWLAAVGLLAVLAIAGGCFGWWNEQVAEAQTVEAQKQRDLATKNADEREAARKLAEAQTIEAKKQTELAQEQTTLAEKNAAEREEQRKRAEAQTVVAQKQTEIANEQKSRALYQLYVSTVRAAAVKVAEGDFAKARNILMTCPPELRKWEWWYLISRCGPLPLQTDKAPNLGDQALMDAIAQANAGLDKMPPRKDETAPGDTKTPKGLDNQVVLDYESYQGRGGTRVQVWRGSGKNAVLLNGFYSGMYGEVPAATLVIPNCLCWAAKVGDQESGSSMASGELFAQDGHYIAPLRERYVAGEQDDPGTPSDPNVETGHDVDTRTWPDNPPSGDQVAYLRFDPADPGVVLADEPTGADLSETALVALDPRRGTVTSRTPTNQSKWAEVPSPAEIPSSTARDAVAKDKLAHPDEDKDGFTFMARKGASGPVILETWGRGNVLLRDGATGDVMGQSTGSVPTEGSNFFVGTYGGRCTLVTGTNLIAGWFWWKDKLVAGVGDLKNNQLLCELEKAGMDVDYAYSVSARLKSSPDGKEIAYELYGRNEHYFAVWDVATGKGIYGGFDSAPSTEQPDDFGWDPAGRFVAIHRPDGMTELRTNFAGKPFALLENITRNSSAPLRVQDIGDPERILIGNGIIELKNYSTVLTLPVGSLVSAGGRLAVIQSRKGLLEVVRMDLLPDAGGDFQPTLTAPEKILGLQLEALDTIQADKLKAKAKAENKEGHYEDGIADLDEAIALNPHIDDYYIDRGAAKLNSGDVDGSLPDFEKALELNPKSEIALSDRGLAKMKKGNLDGAIADFSAAIAGDPKDDFDLLLRGSAYLQQGVYDKALADYQAVIQLQPGEPDGYNGAAMIYAACPDASLRNGAKAVENATKARDLDAQKSGDFMDTLAGAYAENGDFDNAVKWQQMAVAKTTDDQTKSKMEMRLKLYEDKKPYRLTPKEAW